MLTRQVNFNSKNGLYPVSVCVIARDEDHQIAECLESIKDANPLEIIVVVDSRTKDKTFEVARVYTNKVFNVNGNRGKLRNFGWQKALTDFICYVDADMKVPKDYFQYLLSEFKKDTKVAMVGARLLPLGDALPGILEWVVWDHPGIFGTGGSMYRISALKTLNGFNDQLNAGEDSELSSRLESNGYRRILTDSTRSYHRFSQSWKVLLHKWKHGRSGGVTWKLLTLMLVSPLRGIFIAIKYRNPHVIWFYPFRFFYLVFCAGAPDYEPIKEEKGETQ